MKWKYITEKLQEQKAPSKVVNAAREIDNALVSLGLGYNTNEWEEQSKEILSISFLVGDVRSCAACLDARLRDPEVPCYACKLGDITSCTPRSKYADDYLRIVQNYVWGSRNA